jgi:hypothetical protein
MKFLSVLAIAAMLVLASCGRDRTEGNDAPPIPKPDALPTTVTAAPAPAPSPVPPPQVNGPKLMPVDEAKKDPTFLSFRERLLDAVRRHDAEAVVAAADPKIRTSFGEGGGAEALRQMLRQPQVWTDLEQILTLGGSFQEQSFWAPYVYSAWPESQDAFTFVAVIAENVPLRQSPTGAAIATLAYDIVQRAGDPHDGWQEVKLADGRTGFVEAKFIRSPIAYRAGFNKEGDRWRMTAFVSGD